MATMTPRLLKSVLLDAQRALDANETAKARTSLRDYERWSSELPYIAANAMLWRRLKKRLDSSDSAGTWRREMKRLLSARDSIIRRARPEDRKEVKAQWERAYKRASDAARVAEEEAAG